MLMLRRVIEMSAGARSKTNKKARASSLSSKDASNEGEEEIILHGNLLRKVARILEIPTLQQTPSKKKTVAASVN